MKITNNTPEEDFKAIRQNSCDEMLVRMRDVLAESDCTFFEQATTIFHYTSISSNYYFKMESENDKDSVIDLMTDALKTSLKRNLIVKDRSDKNEAE